MEGKTIKDFGWAEGYRSYVELRKKGLKEKAKQVLEIFLAELNKQPTAIKREFINVINETAFLSNDYSTYLPQNIVDKIVNPELEAWMQEEPDNPVPYKWSYDLDLVKRSLELNPGDTIALDLFVKMLINTISMHQHEISSVYVYAGDACKDIELIDFFDTVKMNINDPVKVKEYDKLLSDLKADAQKFCKK
jgi:hypothetical protein